MAIKEEFIEATKLLGIESTAQLPRLLSQLQHSVAMQDHIEVASKCELLIQKLACIKEEHIIYLTEKEQKKWHAHQKQEQ